MAWTVLTEEGLMNIKNHKYKAGVYTPLDNLLNPVWLWLTGLLPEWFAPNLVTMSGLVPMVFAYMMMWTYSPFYVAPLPRWLSLYTAAALFFYQTLDAMDGKQARRTKSSSPLGQLFDHGCDCLTCLALHSMACTVLLPGPNGWCVAGLSALQSGFFLAQWQEHYTGVLCTSFGPVGVTETQYGLILVVLVAGLTGPERTLAFSSQEVELPFAGVHQTAGITCVQVWVLFCMALASISFCKTLGAAAPEGKLGRSLVDLLPAVVLNICCCFWTPDMLEAHPRLFCFVVGLLFFFMTCQMILFSMARMEFPAWQPALFAFVVVTALARVGTMSPALVTGALAALAVALALFVGGWLVTVIGQLKQCLGIHVFSISKPKET